MAHIVRIEAGRVVELHIVCSCDFGGCDAYLRPDDDHSRCGKLDFPAIEANAQRWLAEKGISGEWLCTSFNGRFRGIYAQVGDRYDPDLDIFIAEVPEQ